MNLQRDQNVFKKKVLSQEEVAEPKALPISREQRRSPPKGAATKTDHYLIVIL